MRRGLISRSLVELPDAALDARLSRLRAAMAAAGLDALLVYTNNTRPAGVSWLTGFVPYWSEAMLVVRRDGAPALVVALTFRVKPWIVRTSRVGEVIHTPRIGAECGRLIAAGKADAAVGIVEFDELPAGIAADLRDAGRQLALHDASDLFARVRGRADPSEIMLATRAAVIAAQAFAKALGTAGMTGPRSPTGDQMAGAAPIIAAVEGEARQAGAEEIYVACAPDLARDLRLRRIEGDAALGAAYALRATVAYKGVWVRSTRTMLGGGDGNAAVERAAARFAAAVAELPVTQGLAQFASFLVEGCRMTQPLAPLAGSRLDQSLPLAAGAIVSAQAVVVEDGQPILVAAPVLLGARGEAASIIGPLNS
jgi:hypothetical protein